MSQQPSNLTSAVTVGGASIATAPATQQAGTIILRGGHVPPAAHRVAKPGEAPQLFQQVQAHGEALFEELLRVSARGGPVERALRVIKAVSTYTAKTQFDNKMAMAGVVQTLATATSTGKAVTFILPLGGSKIPNELKTAMGFMPDAGELMAWMRMASMARAVSAALGIQVRVLVLPDAPLHASDLGIPTVEVQRHLDQAQGDLKRLGLSDLVEVVNTASLLPKNFPDEVAQRTAAVQERLQRDAAFAQDVAGQVNSLMFSVNTRQFGWSADHQVLVSLALAGNLWLPKSAVEDAKTLREEVERKVPVYVGTNHAIRSAGVAEHVVKLVHGDSAMVRLTVHAKPGEPQPQLVENSELARPGLLPMHSIGVRFISRDGSVRIATAFALEARLQGQVAVVESESGRTLWYEAAAAAVVSNTTQAA